MKEKGLSVTEYYNTMGPDLGDFEEGEEDIYGDEEDGESEDEPAVGDKRKRDEDDDAENGGEKRKKEEWRVSKLVIKRGIIEGHNSFRAKH